MILYALCINKGNDPADHLAVGKCFGSLGLKDGSTLPSLIA
jgi:hypothetical protein